jgi:enoyl-CoA hydratase/carnithine racemase
MPMRDVATGSAQLRATIDGGVGEIVFDNPARRNALTLDMQRGVARTLAAFDDDPAVRVLLVSGAGGKAFASGADVIEYEESRATAAARAEYDDALDAFWAAWDVFDKPTIAIIRGACIGGGLLVALKADMRVASDDSTFAAAAAALGVGLVTWAVEAVLTAVGPSYASELLFSARRVSAAEALRMGLVNRVVPDPELETTGRALAAQVVAAASATT